MKLCAENLRDDCWIVRPCGQLGTIGWSPKPWEAIFVTAKSSSEAIKKANRIKTAR